MKSASKLEGERKREEAEKKNDEELEENDQILEKNMAKVIGVHELES